MVSNVIKPYLSVPLEIYSKLTAGSPIGNELFNTYL
jgi:hypothetical protein